MKRIVVLMVCVTMAGFTSAMAESPDNETSNEVKNPHHELREAVAKIRLQYSPDSNTLVNYRLAGVDHHMRLGIILGGGGWNPGDEAQPGAVIAAVTPGSPAEEAGLLAGDVVTAFNGAPLVDNGTHGRVASMQAARRLVELSRELEDGDRVTLEFLRDGSDKKVVLVAREIEFDPVIIRQLGERRFGDVYRNYIPYVHPGRGGWFLPRGWLDMELVELNPELGEYFGADSGVLVVRGPQEDDSIGLASGDVILSIGDREVRSPEHTLRILRSYEPEEELTIRIIRRGRSETLTWTVPDQPVRFDFQFDTGGWKKPGDR